MYRICFFLAILLPIPFWSVGAWVENRWGLYDPIGPLFPSEVAGLATFTLLFFGPLIHWPFAARQERLARRRKTEALEALARLENSMISAQAAQTVRLKMQLLDDLPLDLPPKPPSNRGRKKKPMHPAFLAALDAALIGKPVN